MTAIKLSPLSVHSKIDHLLHGEKLVDGVKARRGNESDVETIHQFLTAETDTNTNNLGNGTLPTISSISMSMQYGQGYPIYLLLEKKNEDGQWQLCALAQWSFGYSTWKGRAMNLDTLQLAAYEETGMKCLINIARLFSCSRIVFQTVETQAVDSFVSTHHAEELTGWLTLEMSKDAMKSFLVTRGATLELADEPDRSAQERSDSRCTESPQNQPSDIIINTISRMNNFLANKANDNKQAMTLRLAREEDAASIFELVNGLAVYEKAADEVTINSETYQRDGCGAEHPIFHCILVELHDEDSKSALVVGMGLFYFGYSSSNEGKYLYLEDIFIQEAYRGRGCGKSIMLTLADIAFQSDCNRFVWQALDWNTPALEFYEAIGAKVCTGLVTVRLNEEQI